MAENPGGGIALRREVMLVVIAAALSVMETMFPKPFPFMKPGLANVVTVAVVVKYGTVSGLRLNVLRAVGAALFTGTIATPAFLLSISGGVMSALVMGPARRILSITGTSVTGSMFNMWTQLAMISLLFPGLPVRAMLPMVTVWGILAGVVTGMVAAILLRRGFPWIEEPRLDRLSTHS